MTTPAEPPTLCSYTSDDDTAPCGWPAIWHLLVRDRVRPHAFAMACNSHYAEVGPTEFVLAAHRILPAECGNPTAVWLTNRNRCAPEPAGAPA